MGADNMASQAILKMWARRIVIAAKAMKREAIVLQLTLRDKRVSLLPKLVALLTLAYLVSPIDLIPDFIPVLGLLDDLILIPLAIRLVLWLVPQKIVTELRSKALGRLLLIDAPKWPAVVTILSIWALSLFGIWVVLVKG